MIHRTFAHVIAIVIVATIGVSAHAANFFVSPCGQDIWTGIQPGCMAPHGPKRTIQAAINVANHGDTIFVLPGTYVETINLQGKQIRIVGTGGAAATILDGDGVGPVVLANSGETAATIIEGLTIRGGWTATDGAGMLIAFSSPTIIDCIFHANRADRHGGGIASFASSPTITGTSFVQNFSGTVMGPTAHGGGMYMLGGSPQIIDCDFTNNTSRSGGGGAYVGVNTQATISGTQIFNNSSSGQVSAGGGLRVSGGSATLSGCTINSNVNGNAVSGGGAGVALTDGATATFTNCQFTNQYSGKVRSDGGGAWIVDSTASFFACGFTNNTGARGGAIFAHNSTLGVTFCGFNDNLARAEDQNDSRGGAIYAESSDVTIGLSQFTGNVSRKHGAAVVIYSGAASIQGCVFTGNECQAPMIGSPPEPGVMGDGAGIWTWNMQGTINGCMFTGNIGYRGAGIRLFGTANEVDVIGCTFTGNAAHRDGGGMFSSWGHVNVLNCTFEGNSALANAGGLLINGGVTGAARVEQCVFDGNHAGHSGGGGLFGGNLSVIGSEFTGNTADLGAGAATFVNTKDLTFIGCRFTNNTATANGGAATTLGVLDVRFVNCVITGNTAPFGQGAVYASVNPGLMEPPDFDVPVENWVDLVNCLIVGNTGGGVVNNATATEVNIANSIVRGNMFGAQLGGPELHVAYSNIQGGAPGTGNIDADPLFINPAIGNYRLGDGSPCIDAGSNMLVPADVADINNNDNFTEPTPLDFDGSPRFMNTPGAPKTGCGWPAIVDMGPFETLGVPASELKIADLNGDGIVNAQDLALLLGFWGPCKTDCCPGDLNGDGVVNAQDLAILLGHWGS